MYKLENTPIEYFSKGFRITYRVLDLMHYSFINFVKASLLSVLWFRTKTMYMVEIVVVKTL